MHDPKDYSDLIKLFKNKNYYLNVTENIQFIKKKSYASAPTNY